MSMMMCETCDRFIDTDYDAECFVADTCICERCQEGMLEDGRLIEVDGEIVKPVDTLLAALSKPTGSEK
jgi:hypothetical protein